MLSDNPGPASHPAPARASQPQPQAQVAAIPDLGYVSPRKQLDSRSPTPSSPFQPSQKQQPAQHQHQHQYGLNSPRPSLSPLSQYHSGFSNEDLDPPSPSPSPSPFNLAHHRRQQSFPNLLPLAFRSRTPSPTRKTHTRSPSEQMPYTGDGRSNGRTPTGSPRGGGGGFVSWLSGSAGAASALGLSPLGTNNPTSNSDAPTPDATPTRPRQTSTTTDPTTTPKSANTAASRFMSALSSRFTPTTPTNPSSTAPPDTDTDELYNLDIQSALFPTSPTGGTTIRDPFSPSAFKNLHQTAAGLLARMQTAYREQAAALRDLRAERAAQRDELEEAVTRVQHLKMQLEGMARTVAEQEGVVKSLEGEVEAERRGRVLAEGRLIGSAGGRVEAGSMVSEDLGVEEEERRRRRRRRRRSGGSGVVGMEEEDSEEEDDRSVESESVFSRCRSPALTTATTTTTTTTTTTPPPQQQQHLRGMSVGDGLATPQQQARNTPGSVNATPKLKAAVQMSAFQKILKGISGDEPAAAGCRNCKGQDASVAWDTVGMLRDENRYLKTRVGELEVAVEGALDLVNGIGM